jgi:hypothetical protein
VRAAPQQAGADVRDAEDGTALHAPRAVGAPPGSGGEVVLRVQGLENGAFDLAWTASGGPPSPVRVPGWRTSEAGVRHERADAGRRSRLVLQQGAWAEQPVSAYAPLAGELAVRGSASGAGVVVLRDGAGEARFPVGAAGAGAIGGGSGGDGSGGAGGEVGAGPGASPGGGTRFEIRGADVARALGRAPLPRFVLRLEAAGAGEAVFEALEFETAWPLPEEGALRVEIAALLDAIYATWEERALDERGARRTAFFAQSFDVVSGRELAAVARAPAFFPLQQSLLDACAADGNARWRALLERYLDGLPCLWDPEADRRIDDVPLEVALPLGFLIDVAWQGPERFRAPARAAAVRIGELVLARGVLPDGSVAASYLPRDGAPNLDVSQLRRLDVPCQLARLARLTGDERYLPAAREALYALEYAHHWGGTWDAIDPAFDDGYGHYGARAATIARALPGELAFRRFAVEGLRHFLPLWRDALLLGGNVAADQVRCWRVASDLVWAAPELGPELDRILPLAARAHLRGEQYANGAWGDVTFYRFDPKSALQVGDHPGTPQNLLSGLAALYAPHLRARGSELAGAGPWSAELRAHYTGVLRSTVAEYGRPHGFLAGRSELAGGTPAVGSLRLLLGLTTMLRALAGVEDPP